MKYRVWTEEDEEFLYKNYETMSNAAISEELDRSVKSVKNKIYGWKNKRVMPKKKKAFNEKNVWTTEKEEYLKENYGVMTNQLLMERFDTTNYFLNRKADELGLRKVATVANTPGRGLNVNKVKVRVGSKYQVEKSIMGGYKQMRIVLHFEGELIQETYNHITLRNHKIGRCETFSKVNILLGDYKLKEVI